MMTPEMFRKLAVLGLSHDQMAGVLEIFEQDAEERKAKARARVQKWRDKNKPVTSRNVTERKETSRNATARLTRGVDKSTNSEIKEGKEDNSAPVAPSPQDELETILDGKRAAAVVAHRKGLRKPLTAHAAKLLAGKFAKCPDANAAADLMMARGWTGFEPEWADDKGKSGPGPPGKVITETPWQRQKRAFDEVFDEFERPDQRSIAGAVPQLPGTGTDGQ